MPAVGFVAMQRYVDRYEGWGAWAAAPMLLVPVAISLVFVLIGLGVLQSEWKADAIRRSTSAALLVAAVPLLWIAWRFLVTALG